MQVSRRAIIEAVIRKSLIGEDIDLSQFPNPLPADQGGEAFLSKGRRDGEEKDDIVKAGSKSIAAAEAKPSQSAIYLNKTLGMAVGGVKGGNLNALISADNYILDGHHRWAATMLSDPTASITGTGIAMPMEELIPVLRAAGDAYGNARRGEPEGGDINIFKASMDDALKAIEKLEGGGKFVKAGAASQWLKSIGGEEELSSRLEAIKAKGSTVSAAPPRAQMPVIDADKGEDKNIAMRLNKGAIDVRPPYKELSSKRKEAIPMKENNFINKKGESNMQEQQGFKTTHDEDGSLLYVLPATLTGDMEADVREMWQDEKIASLLWGDLGSDEGITDEAGEHVYWGSDVQDVVQGLQEGALYKVRRNRVQSERYGLLMERMLGIVGLTPLNSVEFREKNWLFEEDDTEESDADAVVGYCPDRSFLSAIEAENEKEKIEDGDNWSEAELKALTKRPKDLKNQ